MGRERNVLRPMTPNRKASTPSLRFHARIAVDALSRANKSRAEKPGLSTQALQWTYHR